MVPTASLAAALVDRLPQDLIEPTAKQGIEKAAQALPSGSLSQYVECRLDGNRSVDLLVSFGSERESQRRVVDFASNRFGNWRRLLPFLKFWSTKWARQVPVVWFELDGVEKNPDTGPSVSACLVPNYLTKEGKSVSAPKANAAELACSIANALLERKLDCERESLLRSCIEKIPGDGRAIHISVMTGRSPCPVKLYVQLPRDELHTYLYEVGWRGPHLQPILERLYSADLIGEHAFLDLSLHEGESAPARLLGLAYAQQGIDPRQGRDSGRVAILESLVKEGCCSEQWSLAARDWPAREWRELPGERGVRQLRRWLDLKLVVDDDRVSAKAYFGMLPARGIF